MRLSHLHLGVRDLPAAIAWFRAVAGLETTYENDDMASFGLGDQSLVLDRAEADSEATLALDSADVDADHAAFLSRGATDAGAPENQPWGARCAYVRGPGALTIELEAPR